MVSKYNLLFSVKFRSMFPSQAEKTENASVPALTKETPPVPAEKENLPVVPETIRAA